MITNVSILEVLSVGAFGSLSIGDSRESVGVILGPPTDVSVVGDEPSSPIWKYGSVEFCFEHNLLTLIHSDANELFFGGNTLSIDPWRLVAGASHDTVLKALDSQGLQYESSTPEGEPEAGVSFVSGFRLGFVLDSNGGLGDKGLRSWSLTNSP